MVCLRIYNLIERIICFDFLIFFCQQQKQTYIDSVNQTGSSASIKTTNEGCFLALRARLSALEFNVLGIWMSYEL